MKRIISVIFTLAICFFAYGGAECQNTLTLDSCRSMALRNNKTISASKEKYLQARQNRKAAFTQFLPNVNAAGAYLYNSKNLSLLSEDALLPVGSKAADGSFTLRLDQMVTADFPDGHGGTITLPVDANGNPFNPMTNPEKVQPKDYALLPKEAMQFDIENIFVGAIGFSQPVFMGGKIVELYRIAGALEGIAALGEENAKINLLIATDEAYWRVVSLQGKLSLAEEYLELLRTTSDNVDALAQEGLATQADRLKVLVKLNQAEMAFVKAENGLRLAKMLLNQICGMDLNTDYFLEQTAQADLALGDLETDTRQSIAQRPESRMLEQRVRIAKSEVNIARSRFLPNVVAGGNYIVSNPNAFNGIEKEFGGYFSLGIGVSMPIFHWGERAHTLSAAKHSYRAAKIERDDALEKMELQAEMMRLKRIEAFREFELAQSTLANAEKTLQNARLSFSEGVITASDLLEAQTLWAEAKSESIDAHINSLLTKLYLEQSLGQITLKEY